MTSNNDMTNTMTNNTMPTTLTTTFGTFDIGEIDIWPWNCEQARRDMGCTGDCNTVFIGSETALLFHVTTEKNAESIMLNGPKAAVCTIGFDGREQPNAFWANCVPFVTHAVEIWMPHIEAEPLAVLAVTVKVEVLRSRYHFEHTWNFAQFALQPDDILSIDRVAPGEFLRYRGAPDAAKLASWWEEHRGESDYFDAVFPPCQ